MEYRYCVIRPKNMDTVYSYIAPEELGEIRINTYVLFPFGKENRLMKGQVLEVGIYTEETAPFPVEKTKQILQIITRSQYEEEDVPTPASADEDVRKSLEEAESYIAAEDYEKIFKWACRHHDDVENPQIMQMVVHCYELCVAQNDPMAALNLGTLYYNGHGVRQDFKKAAALYEIAAKAGELRAICNLGYCWYYGRHAEVNYEKALHYFSLGALLHDDPNCLYKLGDMYDSGKGIEQNRGYAFRLYVRALEMCNSGDCDDFCRADILLRLGRSILEGDVVERDPQVALNYLFPALSGFYDRGKTDPFAGGLIKDTKALIDKAEEMLETEIANFHG